MPHEAARPAPWRRAWWPAVKRLLTWAFFALVVVLVVRQARTIDWDQVLVAVRRYDAITLGLAALLAALSHAIYSTYDLVGKRITHHRLPAPRVIAIALVSYAFNLNFGSLVGGVAFRYRLYSRAGLDNPTVTAVLGASVATNWLGYLLLLGIVGLWHPLELPEDWRIGSHALRVIGVVLLAAPAGYLWLAARSRRREFTLRGHRLQLPPLRVALLQVGLSSLNWATIAAVVWLLLWREVDYASVLGVLLLAAIAGVITHVPAGLGVLEAVFIALLVPPLTVPGLVGVLLTYRAIYYLAPLAVAGALFLTLEAKGKRHARAVATRG